LENEGLNGGVLNCNNKKIVAPKRERLKLMYSIDIDKKKLEYQQRVRSKWHVIKYKKISQKTRKCLIKLF